MPRKTKKTKPPEWPGFDGDKDIYDVGSTNRKRAARAAITLMQYKKLQLCESGPIDADTIQDFVIDLLHMTDRDGVSFAAIVGSAYERWQVER